MLSKKMYYVWWTYLQSEGKVGLKASYVVARTKKGAIKAAKQQFGMPHVLSVELAKGAHPQYDTDLPGSVDTYPVPFHRADYPHLAR